MCRQRARPYLFSNSVPPVIVAAALKVLELIGRSTERRDRLEENARYWRPLLVEASFEVRPGESPVVPVLLYYARLAQDMARDLFAWGVYVVGFFFPVVARGLARISTHLTLKRSQEELKRRMAEVKRLAADLETKNVFIRQTFGRYVTDDVRRIQVQRGLAGVALPRVKPIERPHAGIHGELLLARPEREVVPVRDAVRVRDDERRPRVRVGIHERAERLLVWLAKVENINETSLRYLNRLSDLLFVIARVLARANGGQEVIWKHGDKRG